MSNSKLEVGSKQRVLHKHKVNKNAGQPKVNAELKRSSTLRSEEFNISNNSSEKDSGPNFEEPMTKSKKFKSRR